MNISLSEHFTYKKLFLFTLPPIAMMIFTSIYGIVGGIFVSNIVGETAFADPPDIPQNGRNLYLGSRRRALRVCAHDYFPYRKAKKTIIERSLQKKDPAAYNRSGIIV